MDILKATAIVSKARTQLGKPYNFYAKLELENPDPKDFECSNLVCWSYWQGGGLKIVDGALNQMAFCIPVKNEEKHAGDLGFFIRNGLAYHVVIYCGGVNVVEARAYDDRATFKTGEVILRPVERIEKFERFGGWRRHPELV